MGLYLPIALSTPVMVGGAIRAWIERTAPAEELDEQREAGILFSSGMVGGAALLGVVIAIAIYAAGAGGSGEAPFWVLGYEWMGKLADLVGALAFALLGYALYRTARRRTLALRREVAP